MEQQGNFWFCVGLVHCLSAIQCLFHFLKTFFFCREKVPGLEISLAKCLDVLSGGKKEPSCDKSTTEQTTLYSFPVAYVNNFLLSVRKTLCNGGLHLFVTQEMKVVYNHRNCNQVTAVVTVCFSVMLL